MYNAYVSIALVSMLFMFWRETRTRAFCLPRLLFIFTNAVALVLIFWQGLWGFAIIAINHWLVAIGLSSHVYSVCRGRPPLVFALVLIIAGMFAFALLFVPLRTLTIKVTLPAVGLRVGLGFIHFLYDRWIYKLSDAKVRATIGRDIFWLDKARSGYKEVRNWGSGPLKTRTGDTSWLKHQEDARVYNWDDRPG
jgi:hypothetical protein